MDRILNITNGDSAVENLRAANLPGDYLPWRDVLHEGPVPAGLKLTELSGIRSQFIAERGWGEPGKIKQDFAARDHILKTCADHYDKVILWFEHDLYDQLQILQLLDWFAEHQTPETQLTIVCTEQYLGQTAPSQLPALLIHEKPVSTAQLALGRKCWNAFRSNTPKQWAELLQIDTSALPFLEGAILRMLQEYPAKTNGLSRTATEALKLLQGEPMTFGRLFSKYQQTEERMFLGDWSFLFQLNQMLTAQAPLLSYNGEASIADPQAKDKSISITQTGIEVLNQQRHWLDIYPPNYWLGGVHLTPYNTWCWDGKAIELR